MAGHGASDQLSDVPPRAWRALAVGAAGYVLVGFNGTATNLAFDDIAASFASVPETTTAFVASGYFIATAALLPLAGRIGDRRGRVRMFELGLLVFAVSAVASALAPSVWVLIGARVLQAAGGALVIPASLAMVLPMFPESRRSSAVATWAAAGPASAAVAPSISALFLEWANWRVLYAVSMPVALGVLWIARRMLERGGTQAGQQRLDWVGSAFGTAGIGLVVLAIGKGSDWGWGSAAVIGCFASALAALVVFVVKSLRHPEPVIDLSLFSQRPVAVACSANTLVSVSSLSIWLVWPLYLSRVWDFSSLQIGLALTPGPIAAGTASLLGGRIVDRVGHRTPMRIGTAVMIFSVMWCWLVLSPDGSYLTSFLPAIVSFGAGWGTASPTMNSYTISAVPEPAWGSMNAAFNMLRNVGGAVGIAAAVAIVGGRDRPDIVAAFDRAYLFFVVASIVAATIVWTFAQPTQTRAARA